MTMETFLEAATGLGLSKPSESVPRHTMERVIGVRRWTPKLVSFQTTRAPGFRFTPGNYAKVGLDLLATVPERLRYVPVVTRESCPGALGARVPQLIENGRLESAVGCEP